MTENVDNVQENVQENLQNSENIQPVDDKSSEIPAPEPEKEPELPIAAEDKSETIENVGEKDDELPLPDDNSQKKKEIPEWLKKRIDKEKRAAAMLAAENEKLKKALTVGIPQPLIADNMSPQNVPGLEAPNRADFNSEHEYIAAVVRHENTIAAHRMNTERQAKAMVEAEMEFQGKIKETMSKGAEKYDDFDDKTSVLFSDAFPPNRAMAEAIVDSDFKDDILYFLGTYPDEAVRIAKMNPVQAVKKIAEIEGRFQARAKSKKTTTAPAPINPINTNTSKSAAAATMQDLQRLAETDDQRGFEDMVKKLAQKRVAF